MNRGSNKMTWVKIYITGWLHGSIRWQLDPEERGVWADLIVLAGQCLQGGKICDNDGRSYPIDYVANQLNIPRELLERTLAKCETEGRVTCEDGMIVITNWKAYQSEYERQKKYRGKGSPPRSDDPGKYKKGRYGHMVPTTLEDVEKIRGRKIKPE